MRSRDIDRLMRKFNGDDGLYRIADEYDNRFTWQEGNCWTFARALQVLFNKGELWAACVAEKGTPSHVYLKMDGFYHDSRGRHTEAAAFKDHLEMWMSWETPKLVMRPFDECCQDKINPCIPDRGIDRMVRRMRKLAKGRLK